jgi:hypothetical protein
MSTDLKQSEYTTIPVKIGTKRKVTAAGTKFDTYDDIVNKLLDAYYNQKSQ